MKKIIICIFIVIILGMILNFLSDEIKFRRNNNSTINNKIIENCLNIDKGIYYDNGRIECK